MATLQVRANSPAAPTARSLDAEYDSVTLSWTAPQDSTITGYRVWRGANADDLGAPVTATNSDGDTLAYIRRDLDSESSERCLCICHPDCHFVVTQSTG